ncbi:PLP-dependent aminotransferase family protein [Embleya scabrispora]|uniref:MocR-like pyridoxine biosynthesis transcription factor PdxR n=1 Tax=Embleya scabrispora TaxID=159449 RepID=UPI0003A72458|nr:PLP-dependent aminotransferase family protein [Embleya scabrispora]MYS83343.1 aminotransferase class I/II-fold pyridoxal phosphate-dependent enzyme [Streptomyces sp. SID5474]
MRELLVHLDRSAGRLGAQVQAGLRAAIRSGRLPADFRMPSTRALAESLGVSRGMVVDAYEQLVAEGYLTSRHGSGTRVTAACVAPQPADPTGCDPVIPITHDLKPGVPDLSAFPRAAWSAATRHVLHTAPHAAFDYPGPSGTSELRVALSDYLGRVRAAQARPEHIVVVNGVAQGLSLVSQALRRLGLDVLAVEDPSSDRQRGIFSTHGLTVAYAPTDAEGIDVDALASTGARAVLVTPAHQYPTGVVLSPRRRAALVDWARTHDGLIVEDDYDAEFRYDRDPVGCLQGLAPDRVVHLGSTSKALAPGMRLGWAVLPAPLIERIHDLKTNADLGSATLPQLTLVRMLATGAYERHLRTMRAHYRIRRDAVTEALAEHLPAARVHGVAAGIHLYVELPPGSDESATVRRARERGVRVEPMAAMRALAGGPPAVIIGYAGLSPDRLREAVRLLARSVLPAVAPPS